MKLSLIQAAAERLAVFDLLSPDAIIAARNQNGFVYTPKNAVFSALHDSDLIACSLDIETDEDDIKLIGSIFKARPDAGAIIISAPRYLLDLSKTGPSIPPILDDFAQIIGPTMRRSATVIDALKALKGRNGVLINDHGALVLGRTLDEAGTALLVSEKAAKTMRLSAAIGRPRPIPMWQAKLMNFIYKKKYSKKDQDLKAQAE